ncbi:MAG: hypothetical protein ACRDRH_08640 [Pseudonocardia sp.]
MSPMRLANASASTGLMLSLGTAWGLTHHRWVLVKFIITFVQFNLGIFLLPGALDETAAATRSAGAVPSALVRRRGCARRAGPSRPPPEAPRVPPPPAGG